MTYALVRVPSTFPTTNRPIFVAPIADMANKHKETAWPKMATAVERLVRKYPDDRILVHTVSYPLASHITRHLISALGSSRVLTYREAGERDKVIGKYLANPASVLVAPSLDRGIDLPADLCRVVIITKCPFPFLGDKQVSARLHSPGGSSWYAVQTVRSLVQMTGRGMRSADDRCESFILDQQFVSNVYKRSKALLPSWWKAALDFTAQHVRELSA